MPNDLEFAMALLQGVKTSMLMEFPLMSQESGIDLSVDPDGPIMLDDPTLYVKVGPKVFALNIRRVPDEEWYGYLGKPVPTPTPEVEGE